MGTKQVRTSDISGRDLADNEICEVTVKEAKKKFDCAEEEIKGLKQVTNVLELEVVYADGEKETLLVSKSEFAKLVPPDKLAGFDSNRGRRSGFSPKVVSSQNGSAPSAG